MKIINFSINNYRCISGGLVKNTINFDDSNTIFLFGQNNTGKSSFLRGYKLFYDDSKVDKNDFFKLDEHNAIEIEIEVELTSEDKDQLKVKKLHAEAKYFYGKGNNILKLKKVWTAIDTSSNNFTYLPEENKFVDIGFAGVGEHNVFKKILPKPIFIEAMPDEAGLEEIVNDILSIRVKELGKNKNDKAYQDAVKALAAYQKIIYAADEIASYKDEVNKHFGSMFPDININISEKDVDISKVLAKSFTISFSHLDNKKNPMINIPTHFNNIGHGAIRIALFTLLLLADIADKSKTKKPGKQYIVLFEEPELFLHPKLTKELKELIYEVSNEITPFQVLCASHSPQMIDLTKPKTSIVRLVKKNNTTTLYQVDEDVFLDKKSEVKQEIYEILRFNPYICESFYSDEVILIEGDAEALVLRGYLQVNQSKKNLFIVNCGTVNNIPFFQKIFSKFNITYHLIFDTDGKFSNPDDIQTATSGIQKSIIDQYNNDSSRNDYITGKVYLHDTTFEPAHKHTSIPLALRYPFEIFNNNGEIAISDKPYKANRYWKEILLPNLKHKFINKVPIIAAIKGIIDF
jgi:putative ATP-dependent endonuclease of OLD family